MTPDSELYIAVQDVEKTYDGEKLPPVPRRIWWRMLKCVRNENDLELEDYYVCVNELLVWTSKELKDAKQFLNLVVNEKLRTVTRIGHTIKLTGVEWHTFYVAFRAGESGASQDAWLEHYPGDKQGNGPGAAKNRLKQKLIPLGVTVKNGSGVKLMKLDS